MLHNNDEAVQPAPNKGLTSIPNYVGTITAKFTDAQESFKNFAKAIKKVKKGFHIRWAKLLTCPDCFDAVTEFAKTGDYARLGLIQSSSSGYHEAQKLFYNIETNNGTHMFITTIYKKPVNYYRNLARAALKRRGVAV